MSEGLLFFLLGTAVALVITAIEQRAWTPRRWVYGSFAVLSVLVIPLWGPLGRTFPVAANFLEKIAESPSSWFTLAMVLFIVSLTPFRRPKKKNEQRDAEKLAELEEARVLQTDKIVQGHIDARLAGISRGMEAIWADINGLKSQPRISEEPHYDWIKTTAALDSLYPNEGLGLSEALRIVREKKAFAQQAYQTYSATLGKRDISEAFKPFKEHDQYRDALDESAQADHTYNNLLRNILARFTSLLECGDYVAQGYLQPLDTSKPPAIIPREHWRLLTFDVNSPGFEKASGLNLEYIAIRVAKAEH